MKKLLTVIMMITSVCFLFACGGGEASSKRVENQSSSVEDVLEAGIAEDQGSDLPQESISEDSEDEKPEIPLSTTEGIDVDLTILTSTMVYSQVFDMMTHPEDYVGKTIKMSGDNAVYHYEDTGKYYFACVIMDATACCAQGIEYELPEEYEAPEDYPEDGMEVTVIGVFDTYMEDGLRYCTLRDAELVN